MVELIENTVKKNTDAIYFKVSLKEIIQNQKTQAIKYILDTVDMLVVDDSARKKIRKVVLDNINDMNRVFESTIDSIIDSRNKK